MLAPAAQDDLKITKSYYTRRRWERGGLWWWYRTDMFFKTTQSACSQQASKWAQTIERRAFRENGSVITKMWQVPLVPFHKSICLTWKVESILILSAHYRRKRSKGDRIIARLECRRRHRERVSVSPAYLTESRFLRPSSVTDIRAFNVDFHLSQIQQPPGRMSQGRQRLHPCFN